MDIKPSIQSQYKASLEMLKQAILKCPDDLWDDRAYKNVFWNVAYHALFYTSLYLQPGVKEIAVWGKSKRGYHELGAADREAYTKDEIMEYFERCLEQVAIRVPALDLDAPSGFEWLNFNRLETHIYNIRHLQQHTGELCERLGVAAGIDVDWVGHRRPEAA